METENQLLFLQYPKLTTLNENLDNLDVVGISLLRKYVRGKKSNRPYYAPGMYVYYSEKNYSLSSGFVSKALGLWNAIKREFYEFFCTTSEVYALARARLQKAIGASYVTVAGVVTAAIAKSICVAFGAIIGAVVALVWALFSIGKNAVCRLCK
ncbi:hypothetical protein [Vibrio parahaemolyticus]|uniref:hypothetical protein n=1 Tax=Vibrio parahaemolyticus TaxID=670 RepID=UPI001021FFC3|nr:hypothetical protein [Vibrio parahaemolyticus]